VSEIAEHAPDALMRRSGGRRLRVQLWSYNYDPEPSGIAPLSGVWARAMAERGHDVCVVAAHPHYPTPLWGRRLRPYWETRDGIRVLRLPLWIGRDTSLARIRQELSYMASLAVGAPFAGRPDVKVAVSPCFPALLPTIVSARTRRIPWALWLQDILPDGAATTGLVKSGPILAASRALEARAYRSASRIVVISEAFRRNLESKGVPPEKIATIYNPSARPVAPFSEPSPAGDTRRLLVMGNIGYSQGLAEFVAAIERSEVLATSSAELRIAGHGVARDAVAAEARSDRVKLLGLLLGEAIDAELATASLGIVTQRSDVSEFNLPSKLMHYMGSSVPVLAVVHPDSESARIVREAGAGWVCDARRLEDAPGLIASILSDPDGLRDRARAAHAFAAQHFDPARVAEKFERELAPLAVHPGVTSARPQG
jgi:colanic acid biosynthesis glycosyl transferase WcaI